MRTSQRRKKEVVIEPENCGTIEAKWGELQESKKEEFGTIVHV